MLSLTKLFSFFDTFSVCAVFDAPIEDYLFRLGGSVELLGLAFSFELDLL